MKQRIILIVSKYVMESTDNEDQLLAQVITYQTYLSY